MSDRLNMATPNMARINTKENHYITRTSINEIKHSGLSPGLRLSLTFKTRRYTILPLRNLLEEKMNAIVYMLPTERSEEGGGSEATDNYL